MCLTNTTEFFFSPFGGPWRGKVNVPGKGHVIDTLSSEFSKVKTCSYICCWTRSTSILYFCMFSPIGSSINSLINHYQCIELSVVIFSVLLFVLFTIRLHLKLKIIFLFFIKNNYYKATYIISMSIIYRINIARVLQRDKFVLSLLIIKTNIEDGPVGNEYWIDLCLGLMET